MKLIIELLLALLVHCASRVSCQQNNDNWSLFNNPQVQACFGESTHNASSTINNIEQVSKTLIDGSRYFALNLFRALNQFENQSNGIIFSPHSLWSTLMVAYLGSKGATESEIQSKLKLKDIPKSSVALAFQGIRMWSKLKNEAKNNSNNNNVFSDANRLFVADSLPLNKCFQDLFPNEVEHKHFAKQPTRALEEINEWISNQTNGKIVDLLSSGSITSMTRVIIANAVYYRGVWAQQFDVKNTKKSKFYASPVEELDVDMMSLESASVLYGISEELQVSAVDIPYSNPDYSMLIILPDENKGLDSVVRDLTLNRLTDLTNNMLDNEVDLVIPKFRAEHEFELAGPLYSIGIRKLFDPRYVDLSLIFNTNKTDSMALDSVVHKAYINVNEEGTEAAAATALVLARSGRPAFAAQFIANRPFLYLIRDVSTNSILFVGTVRRPIHD